LTAFTNEGRDWQEFRAADRTDPNPVAAISRREPHEYCEAYGKASGRRVVVHGPRITVGEALSACALMGHHL
jgi:hypothetical protein